ncbi:MAG: metal-dependent phosphohydrolase [Mycobacterium sp.]
MPDDVEDLMRAWEAVIGRHTTHPDANATGVALLALWAEPHRRYHTLGHLRDVLAHVEEVADHAADPDAVRLAAWYHDAVYRGEPDDEECSAQRAEADLAALGVDPSFIAEVARLVRLTTGHDPARGDRNGEALCDADLAVLGTEPDRYRANTAAVRAEYAHVPDGDFRAGRARVVRALLAGPAVFHTPLARSRWESRARANLDRELRSLEDGHACGQQP